MDQSVPPIPNQWRTKVAALLRGGKPESVLIKQRARRDWASLPFSPFDYELREALAVALDDPQVRGKRHQMDEPGETYAFLFNYQSTRIYTKVNLTSADNVVIVYSAHRPLKGEDL